MSGIPKKRQRDRYERLRLEIDLAHEWSKVAIVVGAIFVLTMGLISTTIS